MKKIGILTFHRCINYGAFWQVRCLSDFFTRAGYQPEVLDYGWKGHFLSELKHALRPFQKAPHLDMLRFAIKTLKCYRAQQSIPRTRSFPLRNPPDFSEYDLIAVGSDEVWNLKHPWLGKVPIFFGEKLAPKRLVSYAASFGNYSAADGLASEWVNRLQRFDYISVRDRNSMELVERNVGRSPTLVLDPCLLVDNSKSAKITRPKELFLLVYGNRFYPSLIAETRAWARARNLKIISVGFRNDWADQSILTAGPDDFSQMVQNASAVVTTYFHGCVFSLRFRRPFVAQLSTYRSNKVEGLLAPLNAMHRIYEASIPGRVEGLLSSPIESEVLSLIAEHQKVSADYLQTCLQS